MSGLKAGRMRDYQAVSIRSKVGRKGTLAVNRSTALLHGEQKTRIGDYESTSVTLEGMGQPRVSQMFSGDDDKGQVDISNMNDDQSLVGSFMDKMTEDAGLKRSSSSRLRLPSAV